MKHCVIKRTDRGWRLRLSSDAMEAFVSMVRLAMEVGWGEIEGDDYRKAGEEILSEIDGEF